MTKHVTRQTIAMLLVSMLSGCFPGFWQRPASETTPDARPTTTLADGFKVIRQGDRVVMERTETVLSGRVMLGADDRAVQATVADVVANAAVSIIDTSTNTTVTTSTTDGAGNFQIPLPASWNPATGSNYVIEAVKDQSSATAGKPVLRMRSLIQKISGLGNYASITGTGSIAISPMTTAIYLRSAAGFGAAGVGGASALPLASAGVYGASNGGTVNPSTGALAGTNQFGAWGVTDAQLTTLSTMINESLVANRDALAGFTNPLVPSITSLQPTYAPIGGFVLVTGTGFSPVTGGSTVSFAPGCVAQVWYASPTQLLVTVPAGTGPGNVTVTTRNGPSNGSAFVVQRGLGDPNGTSVLSGISRKTIKAGDTLTLTGTAWVNGSNTVYFASGPSTTVTAAGTYVDTNTLTVTVPATARSGGIYVVNSRGTTNAYWLEVFHTSGTLTEDFTTTTYQDGGNTNVQWQGGASPVGATVSGGNVITLTDWDALNPNAPSSDLQNLQDGLNTTYPAGMQLAMSETNYPVANNTSVPVDQYMDSASVTPYSVATNGRYILAMNSSAQVYMIGHGYGNLSDFARYTQPNVTLTSGLLSTNYKFAGMTNSNSFFAVDETVATVSAVLCYDLSNFVSWTNSAVNLKATDGTSTLVITKIAAGTIGGSAYGMKMASDGTYLYFLGGTATVNGTATYNGSVNAYKFRPDSYAAPTKLTLVSVVQNIAMPATLQFNQYVQFMVDRRGLYIPGYNASGTADSYALYSLRNAASMGRNVGFFRRNGNYTQMCYDALYDQYIGGNYSSNMWYRDRMTQPNFVATASATTAALNLPANQQWASVTLVTDPIPAGATVSLDVLTGAGATIAGFTGLTNVSALNLQPSATANQGSLKFRLNLATPSPYSTSPLVRALIIRTIPVAPQIQSLAYQIPGATSNDVVVLDGIEMQQSQYGGQLSYRYMQSPDNVTWGSWADGLYGISQAYFKFQITASPSAASSVAYQPPVVRKLTFKYHY